MAISVAPERILGPEASAVHGVRAAATLTAFTNALIVVLFGLIPGFNAGNAAVVIAIIGLLFIGGALLRLFPGWRARQIRLILHHELFARVQEHRESSKADRTDDH